MCIKTQKGLAFFFFFAVLSRQERHNSDILTSYYPSHRKGIAGGNERRLNEDIPGGKEETTMSGNIRIHAALFALLLSFMVLAGCDEEISDPLAPVGPDTTSHDFIWEHTIITELDAHGVLHDICYINDTCIWAVGWIGIGADYVNAVRWNGKKWVFEKIIDSIPGYTKQYPHELYLVWGDAPDNIWFSTGTYFIHWDGNRSKTDMSIWSEMRGMLLECWASDRNNIWMGGSNGELVHYDGRRWKRIPTDIPDEWDIRGISGRGDTLVLAVTQFGTTGPTRFYHVMNDQPRFWREDSLPRGVQAVWFDAIDHVWTDGGHSFLWDGDRWLDMNVPYGGYARDMQANNRNDIFICGIINTIRHWNGKTWRSWWKWPGLETARYYGLDLRVNEVWAAGTIGQGNRPLVTYGRR